MSTPTPAPVPDPNATNLADENLENPAESGQDTHYTEQQPDASDRSATYQPPFNAQQDVLTDTDKGVSG